MLFNFEGAAFKWGCSSAGRAPALQAGGQGFDSLHLHHFLRHAEESLMRDERKRLSSSGRELNKPLRTGL